MKKIPWIVHWVYWAIFSCKHTQSLNDFLCNVLLYSLQFWLKGIVLLVSILRVHIYRFLLLLLLCNQSNGFEKTLKQNGQHQINAQKTAHIQFDIRIQKMQNKIQMWNCEKQYSIRIINGMHNIRMHRMRFIEFPTCI